MPTPRFSAVRGESIVTVLPSIAISPVSARSAPARIFTSVDLPAPFSPTSACTSPACRSSETSSSAWIAPNDFEACWSERSGGGRRPSGKAAGRAGSSSGTPRRSFLEVELVYVRLVENERRPEQHRALRADPVRPEAAGLERLAPLAADRAGGMVHRRVGREVAEVGGVPELEAFDRAVLDVLA